MIDWEKFRPLLSELFAHYEEKAGRPHYNEVFMIKVLALQQWYGLYDPQMEREIYG
jgi:hypothetical protein